jgi:DNA-binding transcriptional ArsR family regulator
MSLPAEVPDAERHRAHLRALAHPLRLRILSLLTAAPMTAAEVARELGANHANVSYHLRQLHRAGIIDIAGEEKISGGVAKRYRHDFGKEVARPDVDPQQDAQTSRDHRLVYSAMAVELERRAAAQRPSINNHLTDAELWIDPAVWAEIRDRIEAASDDLHRAAQPPRAPGTIRVNATIALFEMEPGP